MKEQLFYNCTKVKEKTTKRVRHDRQNTTPAIYKNSGWRISEILWSKRVVIPWLLDWHRMWSELQSPALQLCVSTTVTKQPSPTHQEKGYWFSRQENWVHSSWKKSHRLPLVSNHSDRAAQGSSHLPSPGFTTHSWGFWTAGLLAWLLSCLPSVLKDLSSISSLTLFITTHRRTTNLVI